MLENTERLTYDEIMNKYKGEYAVLIGIEPKNPEYMKTSSNIKTAIVAYHSKNINIMDKVQEFELKDSLAFKVRNLEEMDIASDIACGYMVAYGKPFENGEI